MIHLRCAECFESQTKYKMSQRFTVIKANEESPIGEGSDSYGTVKNGQIAGE